jgi:hypothetical protein
MTFYVSIVSGGCAHIIHREYRHRARCGIGIALLLERGDIVPGLFEILRRGERAIIGEKR